jgi:hypothetical protein
VSSLLIRGTAVLLRLLLLLLLDPEADYNDHEDLALWRHQSNVSPVRAVPCVSMSKGA